MLKASEANLRIFCEALEDGEIFRNIGIVNLLEGDFFSWYSSPTQWNNDIASHIRKLLEILARYENASEVFKSKEAIDLFKRLYETIMPQVVRSSLGEFYTPSWLTEHVFKCVKPQKGTWRGLDPCCGSGTFVLTMINAVLKETATETRESQLNSVLNRVQALDLNPLAVLTARINYFIRISHLIPERPPHLQIPVYLGDACYVPKKIEVEGVECLQYSIKTVEKQIEITMPISLVKKTQSFSEIMNNYEKSIKKKDFAGSLKLLTDSLPENEKKECILKELESLTKQLIELEEGKWNGIWARIINNFLITAELGQFEIIIGNPPWIDWKNLPSGYRDRIKSLCVDKKLFSGDHRTGGINLNICALISVISMENWLKDHGKLAFLMPKVIAFQQSYDGYRKFKCNQVSRDFLEFYDWSRAGHPFYPITERFMTYVIGPKSERPEIIPVKNYLKKRMQPKIAGASHISLDEAMERLVEKEAVAGQIMPHNTAFTIVDSIEALESYRKIAGEANYVGREGLELYPQELRLFTFASEPPTKPQDGCVFVQNLQFKKSIYTILPEVIEIETKYLFPVVKSIDIEMFKHNYSGIIAAVPYDKANAKQPLDQNQLKGTKLLDYFLKYKEIFEMQTEYYDKIKGPNSGDFYGITRIGPYSFQENYVAFRDSTKWRATVISPVQTVWGGRKRFVFQNHAASICEDVEGNYITEDEAHYICAILNTPIVENYIIQSSDSRSFKIRPPVKIPKFNIENENHRKLSLLSKEAHKAPENIEKLRKEMQTIYLSIL
jgi:methylase of polypeptide subunit release factors